MSGFAIDGSNGNSARFPRSMPAASRPPELSDPREIVLPTSRGGMVLCCPLTGVGLTTPMARAAGLSPEALLDMFERRAPLGSGGAETWSAVVAGVIEAAETTASETMPIAKGRFSAAVGGNAAAGFSSAQTALEKKRFPQSERDLEDQIRRSPIHVGRPSEDVDVLIADALDVYRGLGLRRAPLAPWHGIMARLHIEGPPDVDLQLHSDVIDEEMRRRSLHDPGIDDRRQADRLGRWHEADVYAAFPTLHSLRKRIVDGGSAIDFEFLGPGGAEKIAAATEWWSLDMSCNRDPQASRVPRGAFERPTASREPVTQRRTRRLVTRGGRRPLRLEVDRTPEPVTSNEVVPYLLGRRETTAVDLQTAADLQERHLDRTISDVRTAVQPAERTPVSEGSDLDLR